MLSKVTGSCHWGICPNTFKNDCSHTACTYLDILRRRLQRVYSDGLFETTDVHQHETIFD